MKTRNKYTSVQLVAACRRWIWIGVLWVSLWTYCEMLCPLPAKSQEILWTTYLAQCATAKNQEQLEKAERFCKLSLNEAQAQGADNKNIVGSLAVLGSIYLKEGRIQDAQDTYKQAFDLDNKLAFYSLQKHLEFLQSLVNLDIKQKQFQQAQDLLSPELAKAKSTLGLNNQTTLALLDLQAQLLNKMGLHQEANAVYDTILEGQKNVNTPNGNVDFGPYLSLLQHRIRENWSPPDDKQDKTAIAEYTIAKDGRLLNVTLKQATGNPAYDDEAINAIKRSAPFPPLPSAYNKDTIRVEFTFDYNVIKSQKWSPYTQAVRQQIRQNWFKTPISKDKLEKTTIISFAISTTGALESTQIQQSSGDSAFDNAALETLKKSAPFAPLPDSLNKDLADHVTFIFNYHQQVLLDIDQALQWMKAKHYPEAETILKQVLQYALTNSNEKGYSLCLLTALYLTQHNTEAATACYKQLKNTLAQQHYMPDYSLQNGLMILASVYNKQQQFAQSEELYQLDVDLQTQTVDRNSARFTLSLNNVGFMQVQEKKLKEAEATFQKALEYDDSVNPKSIADVVRDLDHLGQTLQLEGRYAESEIPLTRSMSMYQTLPSPDPQMQLIHYKTLAATYQALSKKTEADALLQKAQEIEKQFPPPTVQSTTTGSAPVTK
jgi:TonB family protein